MQIDQRGRRRYLFFDKNPLKKKRRGRELQGQSVWGTKKKKNLRKVTPQKETRDDRRRDQNDRERSDLPSPLPRFVVFSFHLSVFIPSARKGWRGEKKRERILKVFLQIVLLRFFSFEKNGKKYIPSLSLSNSSDNNNDTQQQQQQRALRKTKSFALRAKERESGEERRGK